MTDVIRHVKSLCPVCLRSLPAILEKREEGVYISRTCPKHGLFEAPVWRNKLDFDSWIAREDTLSDEENSHCSGDCRSCVDHSQDSCCVILEVTKRCNLNCTFCFAHGGETESEASFDELCGQLDDIMSLAKSPLVQLSGGEPTLRDDLPNLVAYAKRAGCSYIQVNTNGIRLAEDPEFVKRLADAGLDIVFLQFDGTDDDIYKKLRSRDMMEIKSKAIKNCSSCGIGVTLVPTVVRGINDKALGDVIRYAVSNFPAVRAVHFQPVTYLGRYPFLGDSDQRYTLDELIWDVADQTGLPLSAFLPSRCDHALCEFHGTFMLNGSGKLVAMTDRARDERAERSSAERNRNYVAKHWSAALDYKQLTPVNKASSLAGEDLGEMDFDTFIWNMKNRTLTVSAMAFQDASNINLERLYRCSLHVYEDGRLLPFCCKYLSSIPEYM